MVLLFTLVLGALTSRTYLSHNDARDSESLANDENRQDYAHALLYEAVQDEIVDQAWAACDCQQAFPGNPGNVDINASIVSGLTPYLDAATTVFNGGFYTVGYSSFTDQAGPPIPFYNDRYSVGNATYCNGTGQLNVTLIASSNTTNTRAIRQENARYQYNLTRNEETPANLEIDIRTYQDPGPVLRSWKTVRVTC